MVDGASGAGKRVPLTRGRVLGGAVELADEAGIEAVTMRQLAARLGVEAMSLYHHVPNKEALLVGLVDTVVAEIGAAMADDPGPAAAKDWAGALRHLILTARTVMVRHAWAPGLVQRQPALTPAVIGHYDRVLGIMVAGGFSYDLGHRALHVLGSRALGFDAELFGSAGDDDAEPPADLAALAPHITEMIGLAMASHAADPHTMGWCDSQAEFEFALDLVLEGLERRRKAEGRADRVRRSTS